MPASKIAVHEIAHHRNGISGEPFYAVTFTDPYMDDGPTKFVAVVFPPDPGPDGEPMWQQGFHNPRVAMLALDLLPDVTFGVNSWCGDRYASALYAAIVEHNRALL